jgi:hypothetical protein
MGETVQVSDERAHHVGRLLLRGDDAVEIAIDRLELPEAPSLVLGHLDLET